MMNSISMRLYDDQFKKFEIPLYDDQFGKEGISITEIKILS
jgi:hypothetical protein